MKTLALLLTVSVLLLAPALPAEALSLNYNLLMKMNSQHLDQPTALVDNKIGTEAIPQHTSATEQPDIFSPEFNPYKGISEASMGNWETEVQVQTPELVPEPATLILLGSGLIGIAGLNRKLIRFES